MKSPDPKIGAEGWKMFDQKLLSYNPDRMSSGPMPHVTQVMRPYQDFSMIPDDVLTFATERGRRVHAVCAAIARGEWIVRVSPDDAGYVASFRGWMSAAVDQALLVEEEMVHPDWHYCGRPDLVVGIRGDSDASLVDLKTPRTKGRTWAAQLAAYRRLVEAAHPEIRVGRVFSLRLHPAGGPAKVDEYQDDTRDFNGFLSALQAYRYFDVKGEVKCPESNSIS